MISDKTNPVYTSLMPWAIEARTRMIREAKMARKTHPNLMMRISELDKIIPSCRPNSPSKLVPPKQHKERKKIDDATRRALRAESLLEEWFDTGMRRRVALRNRRRGGRGWLVAKFSIKPGEDLTI